LLIRIRVVVVVVVVVRLYSSFLSLIIIFWFKGRTSFIVCMEEFIVEKNVRDDKGFQREEEKTMSSSSTRMKRAWDFWKKIGEPKYAVAPMVAQSERAYRLLTRRYGAQLCFTPMFHSRLFVEREAYQKQVFRDLEEWNRTDRPLFVQFCGNDEDILLKAAKMVEKKCDAVDLNLGCPQGIARRGNYGAFLLSETDLLRRIVSRLATNLSIPVTCKIRLLPTQEATLHLVKTLVDAGCTVLTVHGRTKEEKKQLIGSTDWETIRVIKRSVGIPVISNGGIECFADVQRCLDATECDAVMSSECILENPALYDNDRSFEDLTPLQRQFRLTMEYLDFAEKFPDRDLKPVKKHLMAFLFGPYMLKKELIQEMFRCHTVDELRSAIKKLSESVGDLSDAATSRKLAGAPGKPGVWYMRHRSNEEYKCELTAEQREERQRRKKRSRDEMKAERKRWKKEAKQRLKEARSAAAGAAAHTSTESVRKGSS